MLGIILNTLLRVGLKRMTAMFSPVFFIRPFTNTVFFHFLSYHFEFFTVWYLVVISIGLAIFYEQKLWEALFLVAGIYYAGTLLAFIANFSFVFI